MRKVVAVLCWIALGIPGVAGMNAWSQNSDDLGCGSQARIVSLARTVPLIVTGPFISILAFFYTGFYSEGFTLRACPEPRYCQCDLIK